ncbi:MAG: nitrogenase component 1 [Chthoniobacteraceae bacterium]|nr:nitrogenase component 1 [Chthoniobacteraceae bacterium]
MNVTSAIDNELDEPRFNHCTATRNACKLCTPLGACLVFRGIEGTIPFLHGSQGCSTYIRRYLISHFREPIDIAASNFSEESAVFGGASNFKAGVSNVIRQYQPKMVAVATTCLSETIGEDMDRIFHDYLKESWHEGHPHLIKVSTPSYSGTHIDGFHAAVRAAVAALALPGDRTRRVNLFPGMVSAADLRHLKEIADDFGLPYTLLPDYSESMDGETWSEYEKLQSGGTPIEAIHAAGCAQCSLEFGRTLADFPSAGRFLEERFNIPNRRLGLPIGLRETDALFEALEAASGLPTPAKYNKERGRLVDALIDGHKYVFEKRAIVYGEEDLVTGLAAFLAETGILPVLCASGGKSGRLERNLREVLPMLDERTRIHDGIDFAQIAELAESLKPDFIIGNSKGYALARKLGVPLIRVGFPIHDRIGGQRILHLGYRGAQALYDTIVNALLDVKQTSSPIGYSYL